VARYRRNSLLTELFITYKKYELLTDRQFGSTQQKNTIGAKMEAKLFIEPVLENRGLVIMTVPDVQGAFDSAWWPGTYMA